MLKSNLLQLAVNTNQEFLVSLYHEVFKNVVILG